MHSRVDPLDHPFTVLNRGTLWEPVPTGAEDLAPVQKRATQEDE